MENRAATGSDLIRLNLETGESTDFLVTTANEMAPKVSPDGRWVTFVSTASGVEEDYVMPYSRSTAPQLVSVGGGSDRVWSHDGSELFYRSGSSVAQRPTELFSGPYDFTQGVNWDVAPDGRFLMVKADRATTRQFRVVLNWFDELRAR